MTRTPAEEFELLRGAVEKVQETVQTRMAEDPIREAAFERLYAELKDYKEDFVAKSERPLLLDLLLLYDSFIWFQQSLLKQEMSPEVIADSFQFLIDELLEVLYRRDVVPMQKTEVFDRTAQRAVKVVAAERAEDDSRIAQVLKRGFVRNDKSLRPEEVVVFKWRGDRNSKS